MTESPWDCNGMTGDPAISTTNDGNRCGRKCLTYAETPAANAMALIMVKDFILTIVCEDRV